CFVCLQRGATIYCQGTGCVRRFHLPCAAAGGCVTQYFNEYRYLLSPPHHHWEGLSTSHLTQPSPLAHSSFCWQHRPEQSVAVAPEANTICLICLDPVEDRRGYSTMVCPACRHAWFHRGCIQEQAARSGISGFQCPLCRDRDQFRGEMLTLGIRVPQRLPEWDPDDFASLNQRHGRCDASQCHCPRGREQAEEEGPWQLLLCCSCAAEGTHRSCSHLDNSTASWECHSC
ncbi:PHF7 protein, partial [Bucorvus abyssinicus]|nr:PHF7 protein [Bucorvus abyssinicus]